MDNNDPFHDLTNAHFPTKQEAIQLEITEKQTKKEEREREQQLKRLQKEAERQQKQQAKQNKRENKVGKEDGDLFSEQGTEILGKDRRLLLNKIQQYKELFPDSLKGFRVKRAASVEELKAYLEEIDNIINTSSVDAFLVDSILSSIKMIEGVSAVTKNYNITGLSDMLKVNPHFHSLAKQLMVKYGVFSATPPEMQMVFLVATTAYICKNKNAKKGELMTFLNEPIPNK